MPFEFPNCQILPLPEHQVAFLIDGEERTRWHFGGSYPRPFFYPVNGPSGSSLTRMGHPGAANHDHHRSIWLAHHKVLGIDFWGDQTEAMIRQKSWTAYMDGDDEAIIATKLGWYDGHDPRELLEQELIAAVIPGHGKDWFLEVQAKFTPKAEMLEFEKTNFGFLAVRVAKNISVYFGGGELTNNEGRRGETAIFGRHAKWMDYSGPVPGGSTEGVTYFDHPANPNYPARWHVREDGWMGASVCMDDSITTKKTAPLTLRYLLHVHNGDINADRAGEFAKAFEGRPGFEIVKPQVKHRQSIVQRREE
jgi:hypothetical protein